MYGKKITSSKNSGDVYRIGVKSVIFESALLDWERVRDRRKKLNPIWPNSGQRKSLGPWMYWNIG